MASQLRLRSALALVTGAGGGIGRAVSVRLAAEGAAVAACDLDGAAARETVRLLGGPGSEEGAPCGAHAAFQADVSETRAVRRLLEQVQACFSRPPSVVVSCAGITRDEFLLHMSEDDWDRVIAVNLKGIFLVNQAAAQALVSSGCPGSIINISSIVGKVGNVGQTNYAASKAGVIGLTQTAAREFGRRSFHVTASRTLDSAHTPTTLLGLLLLRTLSSQATKGVAVYGSGMLNMGGRGACDPNKFQILFPATSGSSCVQALRPFPTSPSFPFPEGLFPFTAWSPRATPAAG
nr:estradiol 17-beta-dehydrogenase 8 isoform X1 [Camelus dromedarius]